VLGTNFTDNVMTNKFGPINFYRKTNGSTARDRNPFRVAAILFFP